MATSEKKRGTVLISGYAKLPAHITSEEVYKTLVTVVLVDFESGLISAGECSVITDLSKDFIADLLRGYNLNDGPDKLMAQLELSYFGQAKKAIETSLRAIFAKYEDLKS
ncbi:MAG: DUF3870 domain-containing protein [Oscillospiraceae bacterium]|jgi:hypothetical protein|nr:DUF3870 domain-containing protein [Oscillospiraceae bacterium]